MSDIKKILIIGGGSIGRRHLRNLLALGQKDIKDIIVVEPNRNRADEIVKEFDVPVYSNPSAAYEQKKIDVAFICSPSRFHLEQALFCAEQGSDLFVEKPLSHTLEKVDDLIDLVKRKNLVTLVGSNWKFHPLFIKMKELLDADAIGRVMSARCQFGQYLPDWHPWEDHTKGYSANSALGGGILLDSHEFDYLTWFLGDVSKLACFADRISNVTVDTEDTAEVILTFKSGVIGEIHLDYLQRFFQRNFEFFGERGTIIWDINRQQVEVKTKGIDGKTDREDIISLPEDYEFNQMYVDQIKHFLACVSSREPTGTSIEKGASILRLILAAKESAKNGKIIKL